ncbi:substrate-binding periplasmic protein [Chitinimonas koreensis]|uniref:substrate-binding periplasmic protein n=1 Tax=Chitinimonas koreensis TaxID=356302 RepID=UPI0003FD051B|nr:transporter substrate-binding domain-containing protein [Chitinimonas koreensis]QNM97590.1 transporter substrate-binding domain-containing protein [Chitinimonas koreensis]
MHHAILFTVALAGALALAATEARADTISIRADPWCPYNCAPGNARPGYMIEIAQAVFGAAGHTVDYQSLNWSRALAEARDGRIVAVAGASDQEIVEYKLVPTPQSLGRSINCFLAPRDSAWQYAGPASLAGLKVGTIQDYSYGLALDGFFKSNPGVAQPVTGEDALDRNLEKLARKRLDVLVDDRAVLLYTLASKKIGSEVKEAGCEKNSGSAGLYIAFSPRNPKAREYARLLAEGMQAMRKDGRLKAILAKYGAPDWM